MSLSADMAITQRNTKTLASKTNTKYCTCFIFPEAEPWHHVSMDTHPSISVQPMPTKHIRIHSTAYSETWVHGRGDWIMSIPQRLQSSRLTKTDKPTGGSFACGWAQWKPRITTAVLVSSGPIPHPKQHSIISKAEKPLSLTSTDKQPPVSPLGQAWYKGNKEQLALAPKTKPCSSLLIQFSNFQSKLFLRQGYHAPHESGPCQHYGQLGGGDHNESHGNIH